MCGRFTFEMTWAEIHALYSIHDRKPPSSNFEPRYNIAPTQDVFFIRLDRTGNRELDRGRWWLVPHWAKEIPKATLFNARIETIGVTPAYRDAFESRRCLIPADGYFEWTVNDEDGRKDPWLLQLPEGKGFSFAGLWAHNDKLGITSCSIVTAPAVPQIKHIHDRMPIILDEDAYDAWLAPETSGADAKAALIEKEIDSELEFFRVGRQVNNSRYSGTDTKKPLLNTL